MASLNPNCFEKGTDPENRHFPDLQSIWTGGLSALDFDKDGLTSPLEVAAFLTRN
jgi:hypothetical protein